MLALHILQWIVTNIHRIIFSNFLKPTIDVKFDWQLFPWTEHFEEFKFVMSRPAISTPCWSQGHSDVLTVRRKLYYLIARITILITLNHLNTLLIISYITRLNLSLCSLFQIWKRTVGTFDRSSLDVFQY